jgi:hypothetical protein
MSALRCSTLLYATRRYSSLLVATRRYSSLLVATRRTRVIVYNLKKKNCLVNDGKEWNDFQSCSFFLLLWGLNLLLVTIKTIHHHINHLKKKCERRPAVLSQQLLWATFPAIVFEFSQHKTCFWVLKNPQNIENIPICLVTFGLYCII